METIQFSPKIQITYYTDENGSNPAQMNELYIKYTSFMEYVIHFYHLTEVNFFFNIDNYAGAGIDSDFDLKLWWDTEPQGFVTIRLGNEGRDEIDTGEECRHRLCHELSHVLCFAYLTTYLHYPTRRVDGLFGGGYLLPDDCPIPKMYLELLADTLGLMAQFDQYEEYLARWSVEWTAENQFDTCLYYYNKDPQFAVNFIRTHIQYWATSFSSENVDWKRILDYFLNISEAKEWFQECNEKLGKFEDFMNRSSPIL